MSKQIDVKMNKQEKIPERIQASGKNLPYTIPDSYFDELPGRIQERIHAREKPVIRPNFTRAKQLAVAAIFVGLIAVGYAGFKILLNNNNSLYLSEEEMLETIEYFAYELDNSTLASAIIESDISLDVGTLDSQTEELIQYLSEDDIDFNEFLIDH